MFPSPPPYLRSHYRTIGIVIATILSALFLIDTNEIFHFSYTPNSLLRSSVRVSHDVYADFRGIWRPEYDYDANYEMWDKLYGKVRSIRLLGERHSGTNWITDHLVECFGKEIPVEVEYTKFKHWFQTENITLVTPKSSIVISMYRDPYDWVWSMKERPHHAHDHINLPWLQFVTKPWVGNSYTRGSLDKNITRDGKKNSVTCMEGYSYKEIIPCSFDDELHVKREGYGDYKYELMHDGSERAYSSIVDLRSAKITNHLNVSKFEGARAFYPFRYEDLNDNGTEVLLNLIESATGVKRKCEAVDPKGSTKHKEVPKEFVKWIDQFVDWDVEALVGYSRRR